MATEAADALTIRLPGLDLAALAWGPPNAPPVLALHGWLDNAATFARLAPLLERWRVVAVDLPGHGLSSHHPPGAAYHFLDWVRVIDRIVDALGWSRCSLLGHSMGAAIGVLFAGTFPQRVSCLGLLDGLGPLTEPAASAPQRLMTGIKALRTLESRSEPRVMPSLNVAASRLCEAVPGLTPDAAAVLVRRGTRPESGGYVWRADPRLRAPSLFRLSDDHVVAFLERISCPVLLVRATRGWPFELAYAQRMVSSIPRAWIVEVDGGHHVHLDAPEKVAPVVAALLAL